MERVVKLYGNDIIEIGVDWAKIIFKRESMSSNYWTLEKNCCVIESGVDYFNKYTFIPDEDCPNYAGLNNKKGWTILEAQIKEDYEEWIQRVGAIKGKDEVDINLEEFLYGSSSALVGFLESYKESIRFWDEREI